EPASGITHTSAVIGATLEESNAVYCVTGYWGPTDGGTNHFAWSNAVSFGCHTNADLMSFPQFVTGLDSNTTYYFTFRATNCLDDLWAPTSFSFKTAGNLVVDNGVGMTNVMGSTALSGDLIDGGVGDVTMYYGTSDGSSNAAAWSDSVSVGILPEGPVVRAVTGLLYGIQYYYRVYATNSVGEAWAPTSTPFKTASPEVAILNVTNGLVLWLDAGTIGSNHNQRVHRWGDLSGMNNDALQGNGANQPTFVTNAINRRPAVSFDNAHRLIYPDLSARTVFAVTMADPSATSLDGLVGNIGADDGIRRLGDGAWRHGTGSDGNDFSNPAGSTFAVNGTYFTGNATVAEGLWHIVEVFRGNAVWTFDSVGGYFPNRDYNGDVAELIIYDRVLTTGELTSVGSYLETKYRVGSSYPAIQFEVQNETARVLSSSSAVARATVRGAGAHFAGLVYYGPTDGGTNAGAWSNVVSVGSLDSVNGAVSRTLTGLTEQTTYYYTFRLTNCFEDLWAEPSVVFRTFSDPAGFTNSTKFTFCGYDRPETLLDFPVLIVLGSNINNFAYDRFAYATNAADLRFFDSALMIELNYEIERWNTNGLSYVWVQVPELADSNTCIYAFWGNPAASNPPPYVTNGAAWSRFEAVWHMNENVVDEGAVVGVHRDSTANDHHGDQAGNVTVPGVVARGQDFDGTDDYIQITGAIAQNHLSVSSWFNIDMLNNWDVIINHDGWAAGYLHYQLPTGAARLRYAVNSMIPDTDFPFGFVNDTWYHVVTTFDGDTGDLVAYVNGTEIGRAGGLASNLDISPTPGRIAGWTGGRNFDGQMDEFRISGSVLSSNWVWASWMNGASNDSFICYDEPPPALGAFDLAITKTVSQTNFLFGTSLVYSIEVSNLGSNPVAGVMVTDSLPANVILIMSSPTPSETNGSDYGFNFTFLPTGAVTSITIEAALTNVSALAMTNWVTVASTNLDVNPLNNRASAVTTIPDSDNDGTPNPLDPDDDNDGVPDCDEYIAATDPFDASSFLWLRIMPTGSEDLRTLIFPTSTGRVYWVEGATNLFSGPWNVVQSNLPGLGTVTNLPAGSTRKRLYYRIGVDTP
ncbi:MAG: DUF2341 domain-containing protein, partial [Verrucomicrobiota bacterium]